MGTTCCWAMGFRVLVVGYRVQGLVVSYRVVQGLVVGYRVVFVGYRGASACQ